MNPERGETPLTINGHTYCLRLTLGALAEIEAGLGCEKLSDLSLRLKHISARDMMVVLSALLKGGGEHDQARKLEQLSITPADAIAAITQSFDQALS